MKKKVLINIILVVLLSFFSMSFTIKTIGMDMFFSIKLGEETIKNGLSEIDTLTYHENLRYVNVRYLYNILVYRIYEAYNFDGIYVFAIICNIINFNLIYFITYKTTNKNFKIAFVFTVIAILLSRKYLYARTIHISLTIFLIEFYSIRKLLETDKKKYYLIMLTLPILLVNIHASLFFMFFIIYLPYVFAYLLSKFNKTKNFQLLKKMDFKNYKKLFILLIINIFEGFISPFGIMPYILPFFCIFGKSMQLISELRISSIYVDCIFILVLAISIIIYSEKNKFTDFIYIIVFMILSLFVSRSYLYFIVFVTIIFAIFLANYIENNENKFVLKLKGKGNEFIVLFCIIIFVLGIYELKINYQNDYINESIFPKNATEYLLNNVDLEDKRIFNDFNTGSYLEFNNIKTFIDSRSEMFESGYNDTAILKDYYAVYYTGKLDYKSFIDKYNFDILLINKKYHMYRSIEEDKNKTLKTLYEDDIFIIYEN